MWVGMPRPFPVFFCHQIIDKLTCDFKIPEDERLTMALLTFYFNGKEYCIPCRPAGAESMRHTCQWLLERTATITASHGVRSQGSRAAAGCRALPHTHARVVRVAVGGHVPMRIGIAGASLATHWESPLQPRERWLRERPCMRARWHVQAARHCRL